ncbi:MAG: FAD-dependent oxidoreductase, partial [Pseudomonadota bacterium]
MRAADGARAQPPQRHLVLLGGGHAHVGVLRSLAMRPEPGLRVTLVSREWAAPYSGMLPGYVAGIYSRDECHIDLAPLAWSAGARLIEGEAIGLDPGAKRLRLRGRPALSYDLLSIDVGVAPRLDGLAGAARFTIPVKPVSQFADRWEAALERLAGSRSIGAKLAVVGGG